MDKKYNIIIKNESINIISKNQSKKYINSIKRSESFKIVNLKKKYQDKEIQYMPVQKTIQNQTFEIIRDKPKTKDDFSQYIPTKSSICKSNSYSILKLPKKKRKVTKEMGEQCDIEQKIKSKEIKIGNNKERIHIKKIYEIIEKIWERKQIRKFINNLK